MAGMGQFIKPVQIEVTTDIGADVQVDGGNTPGSELRGLAIMGYYEAADQLFVPRCNSLGQLIVDSTGGGATPIQVEGDPGATITSEADVSVNAAATQTLTAPPAGTRRMTVQVTGGNSSTQIRVREAGGTAGAGRLLLLYGSTLYGGADGAIGQLEVENVAGPTATVHIDFEGN